MFCFGATFFYNYIKSNNISNNLNNPLVTDLLCIPL